MRGVAVDPQVQKGVSLVVLDQLFEEVEYQLLVAVLIWVDDTVVVLVRDAAVGDHLGLVAVPERIFRILYNFFVIASCLCHLDCWM